MDALNGLTCDVLYVDGARLIFAAGDWAKTRADGVDVVRLSCNGLSVVFQAASVYWLYPVGPFWLAGQGSVRYDPNPLVEIIIRPDGVQVERRREFFPDLKISAVKLGWFRHGENLFPGR